MIERATVAGATVTTIGLNRVDLSIGAGVNGVRITGGTGILLVTAGGVAGRISGSLVVTLPAGTTLSGALSLAVNSTTLPVTAGIDVGGRTVARSADVRAGPYVRFEGTDMVLTVLGQSLRGDVTVERATSYGTDGLPGGSGPAADSQTVRLAMSDVSLALGGASPVISVTNGSAVLLLSPRPGWPAGSPAPSPSPSRSSHRPAHSPSRSTPRPAPSSRPSPSAPAPRSASTCRPARTCACRAPESPSPCSARPRPAPWSSPARRMPRAHPCSTSCSAASR